MKKLLIAIVIALIILIPSVFGLCWYFFRNGGAGSDDHDASDHTDDDTQLERNIILGRPTDTSITANVLATKGMDAYIEYGLASGVYTGQTAPVSSASGGPIEIVVSGLSPNSQYFYRLQTRAQGQSAYGPGAENTFHTQRAKGSTFTFVIESDPHLDENTDPALYNVTLANMLEDSPDLLFDLGDTFMSEKLPAKDREHVLARYLMFRDFFNQTCDSAPLFLVPGNHEGEAGWELDGTQDNLAVMTTNIRKEYYPNPSPDDFYSGDSASEEFVGLRENYYGFEWGDALFMALDPYWYTPEKPGNKVDNWGWTLGKEQYDWFRQTLENSSAKFKFVFCHQLVGGAEKDARGGVEFAPYYEMGGKNADGSWGFDEQRPGWGKPLHQLMVENNVSAFFHGHDHFYCQQELDGVVYQECPQPGHPGDQAPGQAKEYGYVTGDILPGSGHIRVTVDGSKATVEFVRAYLPKDEAAGHENGDVASSYTIT